MNKKPLLRVVCAIIIDDGKILAVKRKKGQAMEGLWEFPGGKIEKNESPEISIIREIREELDIEIIPELLIGEIKYVYPEFQILLFPFFCKWVSGKIKLNVHESYKWVLPSALFTLPWSGADEKVVHVLIEKNLNFNINEFP